MGVGDGTVIGATQIHGAESPATAFNIVVLAEGFTAAQQTAFNTAADDLVTTLLATPPFGDPGNVFNVFRVNVESDDTGADDPIAADPPGTGAVVNTYFDATFGAFGIRRLLVCDEALALSVAVAEVPEVSVTLVMVNSTIYGGSGGGAAVYSLGTDASEIAIHEMGHTAFGLADEYSVLAGGVEPAQDVHPGPEPTEPNVTVNDNPATVKWNALFTPGVDLPTMENPDCSTEDLSESPVVAGTVGLFEGADTYHCAAYRPEYNCKMRALLEPFCAVCDSVIAAVLTPAAAVGIPYTQDWSAGNSTFTSMDVYDRDDDGPDPLYPEVQFAEGVTVTGATDVLDWNGTYSDYQSLVAVAARHGQPQRRRGRGLCAERLLVWLFGQHHRHLYAQRHVARRHHLRAADVDPVAGGSYLVARRSIGMRSPRRTRSSATPKPAAPTYVLW